MFYLTGDTHGDFSRVEKFCRKMQTTTNDTMIILGDAGLNFYENRLDSMRKEFAGKIPIVFFCIHGNHEIRPQNISSYVPGTFCGGKVLYEKAYPTILFAVDGEVYDFDGTRCIVIGGAYSIDKYYRLARHSGWWPDEQPSAEIKKVVEARLASLDYKIDVVLSHTCPLKYEPTEVFLHGIDESAVDKSTEQWLDSIEDRLTYKKWYCGHFHTSKAIDKIRFLFEDYTLLETGPSQF